MGQTLNPPIPQPPEEPRSNFGPGEAPSWDYYSKCIHCGLCLNACPTYRELGQEMDSPRGRIYQMIQVAEGRLPLGPNVVHHLDLCLDCRACETACPSGVQYGRLIETARGQIERWYSRPPVEHWLREMFLGEIVPYRRRLEMSGRFLRLFQRSAIESLTGSVLRLLPGRLARVARLAPRMEDPFFFDRLGTVVPARGERRYRVAFFAGCIANLAFAGLNDATVRVLARNGCEVVIPGNQGCCGALQVHAGMRDVARKLARVNIEAFAGAGFDAIITNAAGCGSVLKEYEQLFEAEDSDMLEPARRFASRMRDATEFLAGIEFNRDFRPVCERVTYQDPCHLLHAQRIRSAPRKLIAAVPGVEFIELKETEICCGSAGIYNVTQNEMAERLLANKMRRIDQTGASTILTANPGCLLQLRAGAAASDSGGRKRRVLHVLEFLDEAYKA
ncbi:MAG TPA: heterodisulfide reductase-related iron-sulfur binding cluster [Terriglobia bacterium]|nr:heterodisulfide reductase-related iron-sulfur binding cluster [Terriglobia bacterium]